MFLLLVVVINMIIRLHFLPTLKGAKGEPQFSFELRQATGSGGRKWEVVGATNFIGAARALRICVRSAE